MGCASEMFKCDLAFLSACTPFDVGDMEKFNDSPNFFCKKEEMDKIDWKDALGKAFNMPVPNETDMADADAETQDKGDAVQQQGKTRLDIVLEKKGRGGKQATIVTGFTCDDESLKEVASRLKRSLGVGGSARGGEILIQGDFRQRVLDELQKMGFKARVI